VDGRKRAEKIEMAGRYPEEDGEQERQRTKGVRATPQAGEPGPDAPTLRAGLYRDGGAIPRGAPVPLYVQPFLRRISLVWQDAGRMIEFTPRAAEILRRSIEAARRFNPEARIRVFRKGGGVEFALAEGPEPGDREVEGDGFDVLAGEDIEGVVAVVEPHDQLVVRPADSAPLPGEVFDAGGH
jgi:hypothetical protein